MRRLITLFFVMAICAACGTTYTHPTKSAKQFDRDKRECELLAEQAAARKGAAGQKSDSRICDEVRRCLEQKKGWRPVR